MQELFVPKNRYFAYLGVARISENNTKNRYWYSIRPVARGTREQKKISEMKKFHVWYVKRKTFVSLKFTYRVVLSCNGGALTFAWVAEGFIVAPSYIVASK